MSKSQAFFFSTGSPAYAASQALGRQHLQPVARVVRQSPKWPIATPRRVSGRQGQWRQTPADTLNGSEGFGGLLEGIGPSLGDLTVWGICKSVGRDLLLQAAAFARGLRA